MARHNQGLVFVRPEELVRSCNRPGPPGIRKRAFCKVGIGRPQGVANLLEADSVAVELVRIDFDTNGGPRASPGKHLADTFDLSELLGEDGVSGIVDLGGRNVLRGQRKH